MPTAKKKPAKKATKKTVAHQRSFVRAEEPGPFMAFRVTHQTVYWLIIGILVLAIGVWVLYLSVRIDNLYNDMQVQSAKSDDSLIQNKK